MAKHGECVDLVVADCVKKNYALRIAQKEKEKRNKGCRKVPK
jgi:hypothetical protein